MEEVFLNIAAFFVVAGACYFIIQEDFRKERFLMFIVLLSASLVCYHNVSCWYKQKKIQDTLDTQIKIFKSMVRR